MVHLCGGYIIHNYLPGPRIVLDPISGSYTILLRRHPKDCAIDVAGNMAVGKDSVHPLLPVVPVVVRQVASLREPINSRIFLGMYQGNGRVVCWRIIGWGIVGRGIIPSQWVTLHR